MGSLLDDGSYDVGEEAEVSIDKYQSYFEETKTLNPSWVFLDSPRRKVFRMQNHVIKFGTEVDIREASTLRFVKDSTTIPVPGAVSNGSHAIVMEYVDGLNLEDCWTQLSDEVKRGIARQLRDILHQLRGLKGDYIGGVDRGPAVDTRKSTSSGGPFDSEREFNEFLLRKMVKSTPSLYREAIRQAMKDNHDIVFSHGDLNLHNIRVKDGKIVGLLDWECAGWYPEYWEYVKFCHASCHDRDWHNLGRTIFPKDYPDELIKDQFYALFVF